MSFSKKIKGELISREYTSACCKVAFLSAFLRTSGSVETRGARVGFCFSTENAGAADYVCNLIKGLYSIQPHMRTSTRKDKLTAEFVGDSTLGILAELGILTVGAGGVSVVMGIDKYLVESECCKRAYVAGAFLGGGSCTYPAPGSKTGYHMEFVFSYYETASAFSELLADFDIMAKLIARKNTFVVYLKNNDEIQEVLSIIGADECSLTIAETVVKNDMSNNVNRKLNCDMGNITKQIAASERQLNAIRRITDTVGLGALPKELKEVCELRLSDELLTLGEMAQTLGVSKSCVNHRMRKIINFAEETI